MNIESGLKPRRKTSRREGVALIIVLAFVVILTGVVVAYFSRALANRQISNSSASQTKVALFAQGAADSIIANLQAELQLCSTGTTVVTGTVTHTYYLPASSTNNPGLMLPQMSGTQTNGIALNSWAPNFLIRSAYNQPFFSGTVENIPSGAVQSSSTLPSLNGRSVSMARWNAHYLLPLATGSDSTPITTGTGAFIAPDWVLVARNGSYTTVPTTNNPAASGATWSGTNSSTVIGRYAYAIYHEGGLLDANVAGFPSTTNTNQQGSYKPGLTYADLKALPGFAGNPNAQQLQDQFVAWRNAGSANPTYPYNNPNPFAAAATASGSNFFNFTTSNSSGFLQVSSTNLQGSTGAVSGTGSTDRMFGSRQELIAFMKDGLGLSGTALNILNYLATFTRGLDQPSFVPAAGRPVIINADSNGGNNLVTSPGTSYEFNDSLSKPDPVNPSFLSLRVASTFTRNDGTVANVGDPLVKTRFPLSRLSWITYAGPSATRTIPKSAVPPTDPNYDMWQLVHTYGVSPSYLLLGTPANIYKNFGLVWAIDSEPGTGRGAISSGANSFHDNESKWFYAGHNSAAGIPGSATVSNTTGSISRLQAVANMSSQGRELDFFELLKASVAAGSLAKASMNMGNFTTSSTSAGATSQLAPYAYQAKVDYNLDYAVIQLGANIIDQAKIDGYSTRIVFNDGSDPPHEFRGVENLPYIYRANSATLKLRMESPQFSGTSEVSGTLTDPGVAAIVEIPTIWNPHDANAPMGYPGPAGIYAATTGTGSNFRCIADSDGPDYLLNPSLALSTATATALSSAGGYTGFMGAGYPGAPFNLQTNSNTNGYTASQKLWTTGDNGSGVPLTPPMSLSPASPTPLVPANSWLSFNVPNATLFREPTPLAMAGLPAGSNLAFGAPPTAVQQYNLIQDTAGNKVYQGGTGGFLSDGPNPMNSPFTPNQTKQGYVGTFGAIYPVEYAFGGSGSSEMIYHDDYAELLSYGNGPGPFITYRLQYKDPNAALDSAGTGWVTYDEKYVQFDTIFLDTDFGTSTGNLTDSADGAPGGDWQSYADPRTSRFSPITGRDLGGPVQTPGGSTNLGKNNVAEWADSANDVSVTDRPDVNAGYPVSSYRPLAAGSELEFFSLAAAGWTISQVSSGHYRVGMLEQNSNSTGVTDNGVRFNGDNSANSTTGDGPQPTYYADPDGVVRGAMGYYVTSGGVTPASTTVGLPLATSYVANYNFSTTGTYQGESRPFFLHRPFTSVGELGYVFSGTPWKNIDFFTPQSGDVALLDVFSAYEPPVQATNPNPLVAGVVDLNTQQAPVLQAILEGAYRDEVLASGSVTTPFTPLNLSQAASLMPPPGTSGTAISLLTRTASTAKGQGQLQNVSDLVGRWYPGLTTGTINYSPGFQGPIQDLSGLLPNAFPITVPGGIGSDMQNIDRFRESYIRPLAAVGNTRVWNLLIDVIAQTGRYPTGTTNPQNFIVDGEQRYWVHVAIDRYTGEVLDKQVEVVKE